MTLQNKTRMWQGISLARCSRELSAVCTRVERDWRAPHPPVKPREKPDKQCRLRGSQLSGRKQRQRGSRQQISQSSHNRRSKPQRSSRLGVEWLQLPTRRVAVPHALSLFPLQCRLCDQPPPSQLFLGLESFSDFSFQGLCSSAHSRDSDGVDYLHQLTYMTRNA